eukprot:TRINITY_DN18319_c0_g1_i1.p1 TRINITY_DN18319_c0_g1~~TRINITY_DN18319_c0_g1_i1.p1  ORF type:complete len:115 (+),score=0.61 TRINITY_DN18319_c0_g1_i1:17-361(+)
MRVRARVRACVCTCVYVHPWRPCMSRTVLPLLERTMFVAIQHDACAVELMTPYGCQLTCGCRVTHNTHIRRTHTHNTRTACSRALVVLESILYVSLSLSRPRACISVSFSCSVN